MSSDDYTTSTPRKKLTFTSTLTNNQAKARLANPGDTPPEPPKEPKAHV